MAVYGKRIDFLECIVGFKIVQIAGNPWMTACIRFVHKLEIGWG